MIGRCVKSALMRREAQHRAANTGIAAEHRHSSRTLASGLFKSETSWLKALSSTDQSTVANIGQYRRFFNRNWPNKAVINARARRRGCKYDRTRLSCTSVFTARELPSMRLFISATDTESLQCSISLLRSQLKHLDLCQQLTGILDTLVVTVARILVLFLLFVSLQSITKLTWIAKERVGQRV